jgi:hypothetical protein
MFKSERRAAMNLTRFTKELEKYKGEINQTQYWRYKGGRLPRLLVWLAERPELASALADDARALAAERSTSVAPGAAAVGGV